MTRTTPLRPVDIARIFPELRAHAARATRLHPRPGTPTTAHSSVGGPPLWPAREDWPVCTDGATHYLSDLTTPTVVRTRRSVLAAVRARAAVTGQPHRLTKDEQAELHANGFLDPRTVTRQPVPLIPVAQLYRRDLPDLPFPADADLLQVLWCPLDHPAQGYNPSVKLYWRTRTDVGEPLITFPEPPAVNPDYLLVPCSVRPEQVLEYQYADLLPPELEARITAWEETQATPTGQGLSYQSDLSLAPGWKVGGFANWSLTDPHPMDCSVCGAQMSLLLSAASTEWNGPDCSWRPLEDPPPTPSTPTGVCIGRGYTLYVFVCPESPAHPPATTMQ